MPSRQARRQAERDAAKRKPGQARGEATAGAAVAAEAAGAAAALANLNVNPGGDWSTQATDPNLLIHALGAHILEQRAVSGDREAQFSQGCLLLSEADDTYMFSGAVSLPTKALVGLAV
jgi:hypothetical protein